MAMAMSTTFSFMQPTMLRSFGVKCIPAPLPCRQSRLSTTLKHTFTRANIPSSRTSPFHTLGHTRIATPAALVSPRSFSTSQSFQQRQNTQEQHDQSHTHYANLATPASIAADYYDLTHIPSEAERAQILRDFLLFPSYLSESEQTMLMDAATKKLKRALGKQVRYEDGHFDGVITRYRECSATDWGMAVPQSRLGSADRSTPADIIGNIKHDFFPHEWRWVAPHILELEAGRGGIKPHVDHLDASGEVVAGLCLGSTAVMELVHETDPGKVFRVLLPKGCFYFQRDSVRYQYKHGIPIELEDHSFRGKVYPKDRRISILLRNVNEKTQQSMSQ